jgi:hypothetical protein
MLLREPVFALKVLWEWTVKLRWLKARLRVQQDLGGSPFDEPGPPG